MNIRMHPQVKQPFPGIECTREVLYHRHRLSHQQIDDVMGERQDELVLEEKIHQLKKVARFLEITSALEKENIWFISYKGPLLSYRIYNDATCRIYKDFDFLIRSDKIPETIVVLNRLGYCSRSYRWPSSENRQKRLIFLANQYTLDHPESGISVEIHWSLLKFPAARRKKITAIIDANLQQTVFGNQIFYQFTPELELLHLVIHGSLHTWSRLKWLTDVNEFIQRIQFDEKKFEALTKQLHAGRLVALCNALLRLYFPQTVMLPCRSEAPDWFIEYALHQLNRTSDTPVYLPQDLFKYRWFHIHAFPRWNQKLKKVLVLFVFYLQNKKRKLLALKTAKSKGSSFNVLQ